MGRTLSTVLSIRMRIGVFSYDYDPPIGGLGKVVKETIAAQSQASGHQSYLIFSPSPGAPRSVSKLARFFWNRCGGCPVFSLTLGFTLSRLLRTHRLDLLHVHSGSGGVWLLQKPGCPCIATAHHTYYQEAEHVYRSNRLKYWWKRLMGSLERRTYRIADRVVCVSEDTRNVIVSAYKIPAAKVCVIENGIDLTRLRMSDPVTKDGNTILYVGRLELRKGIWTLLKAFAKLRAKHPALKLRLVGSNLLGATLDQFLKQNRLTSAVTLTGFMQLPLLMREMRAATVIVIPSLIEGFGLTAAEGMAAGTCVVGSDADGLKSVIDDGRTGRLFHSGDVDHCIAVIEEVLSRPDQRAFLERCAKSEAEIRFSLPTQARKVQQLYDDVLSVEELKTQGIGYRKEQKMYTIDGIQR